jgi:uncharacterized protein
MEFVGKTLLLKIEARSVLVVGDLHLGYEQALNDSGVLVNREMFEEMIGEFGSVFLKTGVVDEVVLLGDVKHVFGRVNRQEWSDVLRLFDYFLQWCGKVVVVKGNHDIFLPGVIKQRENVSLEESYCFGGVCFVHGDKKIDLDCGVLVMGHGHPAVKISGGVRSEKYKCFLVGNWDGRRVVIVPSFFSGFEGTDVRDGNFQDWKEKWGFDLNNFNVKVVQGLGVLDFGELGKV